MYNDYLLQLEEAGKIRNLKHSTIDGYKSYVSYFLNSVNKNPEELTCQDVREFLLRKKGECLKATTLNLYNSAIRFFFRNVLHILWDDITVPRMMIEHKLPVILSAEEIDRLLDATKDLKYKAMFATMYSSGMRVSEVIYLHYGDISRTNMQIHIRDTKNRMDRYTILSKRNLEILTEYWFCNGRPREILFPNKFTGQYHLSRLRDKEIPEILEQLYGIKICDDHLIALFVLGNPGLLVPHESKGKLYVLKPTDLVLILGI